MKKGNVLERIGHGAKCLIFFLLGNLMALLFYDRKYLKGKYFTGGHFYGVTACGWKWATYDGISRILLGINWGVPWPVSHRVIVTHPENIEFDLEDLHIFHTSGTYFQAIDAKLKIGKGTWIAPNVGLITANHDPCDLNKHLPGKDIVLGENCWIGMNAVILPGVTLGPGTIVGANAVVTKSFPEGNCVIAGNPARQIKVLFEEEKT